jgi:hypothetical protein
MALNLSAFENKKTTTGGTFAMRDKVQTLTLGGVTSGEAFGFPKSTTAAPSPVVQAPAIAKKESIFAPTGYLGKETWKQMLGIGERPSALKETVAGIPKAVKEAFEPTGYLGKETLKYLPETLPIASKVVEKAVKGAFLPTKLIGALDKVTGISKKVDELKWNIEKKVAPIVGMTAEQVEKKRMAAIQQTTKEQEEMSKMATRYPVLNMTGQFAAEIGNLYVFSQIFAPVSAKIASLITPEEFIAHPLLSTFVTNYPSAALSFGSMNLLRETATEIENKQFSPFKLTEEFSKGFAYGTGASLISTLVSGARIPSIQTGYQPQPLTTPQRIFGSALGGGALTTLEKLLVNHKLTVDDVPDIAKSATLFAIFEAINGEESARIYNARVRENMQRAYAYREFGEDFVRTTSGIKAIADEADVHTNEFSSSYRQQEVLFNAKLERQVAEGLMTAEEAKLAYKKFTFGTTAARLYDKIAAYTQLRADNDYITSDETGKIIIVNEFTGRLEPGKQYTKFLQDAIELKEGIVFKPTPGKPVPPVGVVRNFSDILTPEEMVIMEYVNQNMGDNAPLARLFIEKNPEIRQQIVQQPDIVTQMEKQFTMPSAPMTQAEIPERILGGRVNILAPDIISHTISDLSRQAEIAKMPDLATKIKSIKIPQQVRSVAELQRIVINALTPEERIQASTFLKNRFSQLKSQESQPKEFSGMFVTPKAEETVTVYHGTEKMNAEIIDKQGVIKPTEKGGEISLTTSKEEAMKYMGEGGKMYELQVPKSELKKVSLTEYVYKKGELPIQPTKAEVPITQKAIPKEFQSLAQEAMKFENWKDFRESLRKTPDDFNKIRIAFTKYEKVPKGEVGYKLGAERMSNNPFEDFYNQALKEVKPEVTKPTVTPKEVKVTPAEEKEGKEIYQAEYERVQKVGEGKITSDILSLGGLKTDPTLKEEMSDLPISIMRKGGLAPDEMRETLNNNRGYRLESVSDMFDSIRAISSMPSRYRPAESVLDQKLTTIRAIRTKMPKIKEVTASQLERLERQILKEAKVGRNIPPKQVIAKVTGLKPEPEKMITKKESQFLKMKLRAEAKGATEGMRQSRAEIISQLRITRTDTTDIRRQITDYVKQALDPSDRGKANVLIRDAKNQEDLVKAFSRIDRWAENAEKKAIRNDVVSSVKKAIESPAVAIDYKAKIKEVIDEFELKGHLGRTLEKLNATKKYIDERLSAGEDIEIPQRIWNSLKILTRKPYEELTVSELKGLQDEVKILDAVGRMKWATFKDIYNLEQTAIKDALTEGTTPMERREKITPKIGEKLSLNQRFKNYAIGMANEAKKVDKVILPMDALFDWLDGAKGTFSGANTRLIKNKIDRGWNLYQTLKDDIQDPIVEKAVSLKMKDMNMERIGFVAAREQEGGMAKLEQLGYTEEEVNAVKLTEDEQTMLNMMRDAMEKEYPYVVDIMRKVYNQPVGKVKNYFSFMTDWSKTDEVEIYKRMGPGAEEFGLPTKTVEQGFTIPRRVMAKQKIKLNAMSIFLRHTDNTSYLRSLGRDIKMLFEIVNSGEYQKASGDLGQLLVLEWLDLMARKGGSAGGKKIALIDTMRKNLGAGMIGFKLSSAAVQWTEVIPAMGLIGPEYGMKGIFNIAVSHDWRKFVMKFPEIRNRSGGETAIQELTQGSAFRKLQAKAFLPLEKIDTWGAMSVAAGAYEKKMAELGKEIDLSKEPNQEAMEYAQQIVRRNQGVAGYKDTPLAISRGALTGSTSIDRAFLQFQNFVLFRWSRIRYEAIKAGIDAKDPLKVAGILFWTIMGMIAAVGTKMGVDALSDFVTGKESNNQGALKKFVYEAVGTVPFLGNLYGSYLYDNELIPIFSAPSQALQDLKKAISSKNENTRAKGLAGFITTLMTLMGVPGMLQTQQLIKKAIPTTETAPTMPGKLKSPFEEKGPGKMKSPFNLKSSIENIITNLLKKELA